MIFVSSARSEGKVVWEAELKWVSLLGLGLELCSFRVLFYVCKHQPQTHRQPHTQNPKARFSLWWKSEFEIQGSAAIVIRFNKSTCPDVVSNLEVYASMVTQLRPRTGVDATRHVAQLLEQRAFTFVVCCYFRHKLSSCKGLLVMIPRPNPPHSPQVLTMLDNEGGALCIRCAR